MSEVKDWRLTENRREAFQRFYRFHLRYKAHPGAVYSLLPAIAQAYDLSDEQKAWLVWLNGNTQNVVTSMLLLDAAPWPSDWRDAVALWNDRFTDLEWDTDRRHQKSKFGEATERWWFERGATAGEDWALVGDLGWGPTWEYASSQPYMGRLSSWSMIEYARILFGPSIPDAATWLLEDLSGSRSHRNGLAVVAGYPGAQDWPANQARKLRIVPKLEALAEDLLAEARERNAGTPWAEDVSRLTMESALCTYKSWHKPRRRYPNVYSDMMYLRIKRGEERFGDRFQLLWDTRRAHLPPHLRLEDSPLDPGLSADKQNHYLLTGQPIMMEQEYPDMPSDFAIAVAEGAYGRRKR